MNNKELDFNSVEQFSREHVSRVCYNVDVSPIWLDNDNFVYEHQNQAGNQFIKVDCRNGEKTTLQNYTKDSVVASPKKATSADGRYEIFTKEYNLYVKDTADDSVTQLSHDGTEDAAYAQIPGTCRIPLQIELGRVPWPMPGRFSPDGRYFLTHQLDERNVNFYHILDNTAKQGVAKHYQYHHPYAGDEYVTYQNLVLVDLENKTLQRLNCDKLYVEFFTVFGFKDYIWWSKDCSKVFYMRLQRGYKKLQLCEYDLATNTETVLVEETHDKYIELNAVLFWDSNSRISESSNEIIWWSERSDWGHLYLYDKQSGQLKNAITSGEWLVLDVLRVDEEKRQIYFTGCGREKGDPYYRYLYRVDFDGNNLQCLTKAEAEHKITFSPNGDYFIDTYSTVRTAPVIEVRNCQGDLITTVVEADISALDDYHWQRPEAFCVTALDGKTKLYGEIFKPSNFDASKKYPVIDHVYPGPQNIHVPKAFYCDGNAVAYRWPGMWHMQALAECGFIVVCVDTAGSSMRQRSFREASYGKMHSASLPEHKAALEQLAQQHSYMDLNRVGITGHSAGGYLSARAVLTYPEFYKVAVAGSGVHDLKNFMAYWSEKYQGLVESGNYKGTENHSLVEQLQGKLLLIHGELDDNVHVHHSISLYDALLKAGKGHLAELLLLPDCHHECDEHPEYMRRRWQFFVENL